VDWAKVPLFLMMVTKATDGVSYPAAKQAIHRGYYRTFRERGHRYIGSYHWLRGSSPAKAQADYYLAWLDSVGGLQHGEFVMLDWETTPNVADPTVAQVEEWCDRVCQRVQRDVMVYSSDWVPGWKQWRDRNPTVPYWHANYRTGNGPNDGRTECVRYGASVWQWTSTASVPGFAGGVDANEILHVDVLDRLCDYEGNDEMTQAEYDALVKQIADLTALTWKMAADVEAIKQALRLP
jgi:lysozyme